MEWVKSSLLYLERHLTECRPVPASAKTAILHRRESLLNFNMCAHLEELTFYSVPTSLLDSIIMGK